MSDLRSHTGMRGRRDSRFEILRPLGRGATSVVYAARDTATGAEVALKTLLSFEPARIYDLKHEFRALAGFHHPHLVQLYDLVVDEGDCFFTMELLRGPNFLDFVRGTAGSGSGFDAERLRDGLAQLCSGLAALHAKGTLHRDIKPSNVLVDRDARVVLLDFGLASGVESKLSRVSREHGLAGTLAYMAPEQLWDQTATAASDWYSVGIMLYECLTGQLPRDSSAPNALVRRRDFVPPAPAAVVAGIPPELDALVASLIDPDPDKRPAGDEVLARLAPPVAAPRPLASRRREPSPASLFVGRGEELASLRRAFAATVDGHAAMVRVHGTSGIGKTALIEHFLGELEDERTVLVLRARCYPQETIPFKAVDGLIDQLSRYLSRQMAGQLEVLMPRHVDALVRLFSVLGRVPFPAAARGAALAEEAPHIVRRRAEMALRDLLGRLADRIPLVLWVDDVQWGDTDSATLLRGVLRPPDPPPLLVLLSYRSEHRGSNPLLQAIEAEQLGAELELERDLTIGPLAGADARALADGLLSQAGIHSEHTVATITAESHGSPFFISQLAHTLIATHDTAPSEGGHLRVEHVVRRRLSHLSEGERRLLAVVSVSNGSVDRRLALDAAHLGPAGQPLIAKLVHECLLRLTTLDDSIAVELYHDRIGEALRPQIDAVERADCHRALARLLEARGGTAPDVLAHHLHGAGELEKAASYAAVAADKAALALAFEQAAELYRLALDWGRHDALTERAITVKRATALVKAGRCAEAAPLFLSVADRAPREEALELRRLAAEQLLVSGRIDEGRAILRPLLEELGLRYPASPPAAIAWTVGQIAARAVRGTRYRARDAAAAAPATRTRTDLCYSAVRGLIHVDSLRGGCLSLLALSLALRDGEPVRVGRSLVMVGSSVLSPFGGWLGRWGRKLVEEGARIAVATRDPTLEGLVTIGQATIAMMGGEWQTALDRADEAIELLRAKCQGANWEINVARMIGLRSLEELGRLHDCAARAAEFADEAELLGDRYAAVTASQFVCLAHIGGGDVARGRSAIETALAPWSQEGFHIQHFYTLRLQIYGDLHEGEPLGAWERLATAWQELEGSHLLRIPMVGLDAKVLRARAALALAAADRGRRPLLARQCQRDMRWLAARPRATGPAHAAMLRAGLATLAGDTAGALAALEHAAGAYARNGMAAHSACAELCMGRLLGGERGTQLDQRAAVALRACGIAHPDRWAAIYAPGAWRGGAQPTRT